MDNQPIHTHQPCSNCGSSDALTIYEDHTYCFSCQKNTKTSTTEAPTQPKPAVPTSFVTGQVTALNKRKLNEDICKKYRYTVGQLNGTHCQIAPFFKDGQLVGQKLRSPDKSFQTRGEVVGLWGKHACQSKGRRVVITEGEIDCLSVAQTLSTWPVVSLPNGATSAAKAIKADLEWLLNFDEIVLWFDGDEAGQKAAADVAPLLPAGRVFIVEMPEGYKDANDLLVDNKSSEITKLCWEAKEFRPDGVLMMSDPDVWKSVETFDFGMGKRFPWTTVVERRGERIDDALNHLTRGIKPASLVMLTAGTGVGKSTVVREIAYDLAMHQDTRVGMVFLEEPMARTVLGLLSTATGRNLTLANKDSVNLNELKPEFEKLSEKIALYDHFGSLDFDNLLSRLNYMAVSLNCEVIILDHISIVVSGIDHDDERKAIDMMMTRLRQLCEQTGVTIIGVSHLKKTGGKPHEEGGQVSLQDFRGSGAIAQLSDLCLALERNQQSEDDDRNQTNIRVLKSRLVGETGLVGTLVYDRETGKLTPQSEFDPINEF